MWFIVKISFVKKKNCPDNLNYYTTKNNYILKMTTKFQDPQTAAKTYWAILSRLLYKTKIPAIAPFFVNGKFVSDFCEKANLFNNVFASMCTQIKNSSALSLFS